MNNSKYKLPAAILVLVTIIGLGFWLYSSNQVGDAVSESTNANSQATETPETGRTEITYLAKPGLTSLEQLQDEATEVVIEESEWGKLITSIEGHTGGTDGKYWSFYVNGEMAAVGADSYIQQEGDWIEWKFQNL